MVFGSQKTGLIFELVWKDSIMIKLIISTINKKYFINMKNYIEGKTNNNFFVGLYLSKKNYKTLINISRNFDDYKEPLDSEFDNKLKEKKMIFMLWYVCKTQFTVV